MGEMRVALSTRGKYATVRSYGRYGSIAVTRDVRLDKYALTHVLTSQRISDTRFTSLTVARQCARALAEREGDWRVVDALAVPMMADPWDTKARTAFHTKRINIIGRRIQRIITKYAESEARRG